MANDEKKAPETTQVVTDEAEKKETKKAKKEAKKVYKLRSGEKFLTVGSLGVQFFNGKYETTDADEARALLTIDAVELEEE